MEENRRWLAEFGLKVIASGLALWGAFQAFRDYKQKKDEDLAVAQQQVKVARHDVEMKILDYKLRIYGEALQAASEVALSSQRDFGAKLDRFGAVKHGELQMIADDTAYLPTIEFWNDAVKMFNNGQFNAEKLHENLERLGRAYKDSLQHEFGTEHVPNTTPGPTPAIPTKTTARLPLSSSEH